MSKFSPERTVRKAKAVSYKVKRKKVSAIDAGLSGLAVALLTLSACGFAFTAWAFFYAGPGSNSGSTPELIQQAPETK